MSVDLVGSTALKQSGEFPIKEPKKSAELREASAAWVHDLSSFYRDIEAYFSRCVKRYRTEVDKPAGWPDDITARLWKINGDELIFVHELAECRECAALIWCWLEACKIFRADLKKKKAKLDVKMTAWTAGFPISNAEVIFGKTGLTDTSDYDPLVLHYTLLESWHNGGDRAALTQDFIGPSIDTGFRLAGRSNPRRFVISLEIAYVLTTITCPAAIQMDIFYAGQESLKGVLGGKPYPIFWIDTHVADSLSQTEDKLSGLRKPDGRDIQRFCDEYIRDNEAYMFRPFVVGDPEPFFCQIPQHYETKLGQIADAWKRAKDNRETFEQSLAEKDTRGVGEDASGGVAVRLPPLKNG